MPETPVKRAHIVAERVREAIAAESFSTAGGLVYRVTCSIGVAELERGPEDGPALLIRTARAMYAAKQAGRNRVTLAGPYVEPRAASPARARRHRDDVGASRATWSSSSWTYWPLKGGVHGIDAEDDDGPVVLAAVLDHRGVSSRSASRSRSAKACAHASWRARGTSRRQTAGPPMRRARLASHSSSRARWSSRVTSGSEVKNRSAIALKALDGRAEARERFQRALAISEKNLAPVHPTVAAILNNLGSSYRIEVVLVVVPARPRDPGGLAAEIALLRVQAGGVRNRTSVN